MTDYSLFNILMAAMSLIGAEGTASVVFSNISARIVSATVNFTVNRKLVFKSNKGAVSSGLQYFSLAACILAGNTLLLNGLVNYAGVNSAAAKLVTEITFFALSWTVQRFVIFRRQYDNEKETDVPATGTSDPPNGIGERKLMTGTR